MAYCLAARVIGLGITFYSIARYTYTSHSINFYSSESTRIFVCKWVFAHFILALFCYIRLNRLLYHIYHIINWIIHSKCVNFFHKSYDFLLMFFFVFVVALCCVFLVSFYLVLWNFVICKAATTWLLNIWLLFMVILLFQVKSFYFKTISLKYFTCEILVLESKTKKKAHRAISALCGKL